MEIKKKVRLLTLKSPVEEVRAYLNGEYDTEQVELSDSLEDKLLRIEYCRGKISEGLPRYRIYLTLCQEYNIQTGQARNIYYETITVYDEARLHIERTLSVLYQAMDIATLQQDSKGMVKSAQAIQKTIENYYGESIKQAYDKISLPKTLVLSHNVGILPMYEQSIEEQHHAQATAELLEQAKELRTQLLQSRTVSPTVINIDSHQKQ